MLTLEGKLTIEYEKAYKRITQIILKDVKLLENATEKQIKTIIERIKLKTGSLASIRSILSELSIKNYNFAKDVVPHIYTQSQKDALKLMNIDQKIITFTTIDKKAVTELQRRLYNNLYGSNIAIGKNIMSLYKEEMVGYATRQLTSGESTKQLAFEFIDDLARKGIFSITDKNGRKINSLAYAKMNIKTTYSSAINSASINQTVELGNDLVRMSQHYASCEVCGMYQGRVYSISGKSTEYKALAGINDGAVVSHGIVHPNCRHRFTPYVPTLDDNKEQMQKDSNKEFKDNRSDDSKASYDKRQDRNRWDNEIVTVNEGIKILETLPTVERSPKQQEYLNKLRKKRTELKDKITNKNKKWKMDN